MTHSGRNTRVYIFVADSTSLAAFDLMLLTVKKSDTVKNDKEIALKGDLRSSIMLPMESPCTTSY